MRLFYQSIIVIYLLAASVASGATYHMPSECANLQACFAVMVGGDTLIIADGTYTGASNQISDTNHPPVGTASAYTKIQAENTGAVSFGDASVETLYLNHQTGIGNAYIQYDGIVWLGGLVFTSGTNYLKFFNCGAGTNVATTAASNFNFTNGNHALFENCYAWGGGRYKFVAYQSSYAIFRRCVGRIDAVNMAFPLGGVAFYNASNCEAQNCIIIDSNTPSYWTYESLVGAFTMPNGSGTNNAFRGCIALNNSMPLHSVSAGYTSGIVYDNIVGWNVMSGSLLRGNVSYRHLTMGAVSTALGNYAAVQQYEGATSLANSLLTGISLSYGAIGGGGLTSDYNYLYNNAVNYYGTTPGAHDVTNINPLTASLKYLPRVETGSSLSGVASDGGNIGATIIKRIGVSGTFYGDTGYNTTTTDDLWPFPNEALIKTRFASYTYSGVAGARGFAATGKQLNGTDDITLTSYVWEYLGNAIPSDIYGAPPDPTCSAPNGIQDGDETGIDCGGSCPACSGGTPTRTRVYMGITPVSVGSTAVQ